MQKLTHERLEILEKEIFIHYLETFSYKVAILTRH